MITKEHVGPLVYGGVVTLTKWWDAKRMEKAGSTLKQSDIFKMASTWSFLGIGLAALAGTIWWRKYQGWTDRLTAGFLYGLPGFVYETMKATSKGTAGTGSRGIAEAQAILNAKRANAALGAGASTARSYQQDFANVTQY
jgi:hypothetical protein